MEVKEYNQYIVKVDGTGRLTLRNRQFLRRYRPHQLFGFSPPPQPYLVASDPSPPLSCPMQTVPARPLVVTGGLRMEPRNPLRRLVRLCVPKRGGTVLQVAEPSSTPEEPSLPPPPPPPGLRRSNRLRHPTKVYDPATGAYVAHNC